MYWANPMYRRGVLLACVIAIAGVASDAKAQWPQWGGPNRDFVVDTTRLATNWPEDGPQRLWHRTLGTGYSAIAVDDGMLFTIYRKTKPDKYEFTIALNARTGKTIWQKRNLAAVPASTADYGKEFSGPNSTPLIVGDRLYTVGRNAALHCFQKADGKTIWKHDLLKKFSAQIETCGYSPSPIAYGNTIILPLGRAANDKREGSSLVAFDQETGDVAWKRHTFNICHSTPIIINLDGEEQLVFCTTDAVMGVKPHDGQLIWKQEIPADDFKRVFTTPVWNGKDMLYCASSNTGYGIKLVRSEGKTQSEQIWSSRKTHLGMGNPVLIGDMLVGPKRGEPAQAALLGVDINTGERLWHNRAFPMAVLLGNREKLIILGHKGNLGLATATREGVAVHSDAQITKQWSFTCPTLVGTTLYVRDEEHIMALDLGARTTGEEG